MLQQNITRLFSSPDARWHLDRFYNDHAKKRLVPFSLSLRRVGSRPRCRASPRGVSENVGRHQRHRTELAEVSSSRRPAAVAQRLAR